MALALLLLLDFGTPKSPAAEGWTALLPSTVAAADAPGWVDPQGLTAQDNHYPRVIPNASRGRDEPPPCYTNDLTRDAIWGTAPARLQVDLPAGRYELWAVAGSSVATRGVLYDFALRVAGAEVGFQMQGSNWFETRRVQFTAPGGPLAIDLAPKSRWILSGLAIYRADDASARQLLQPFEDDIYALPADVMPQWKEQPHRDPLQPDATGTAKPWAPLAPLRQADVQRGYLVHQRHWSENIYPTTVPYRTELDPTLRAFATPGEAEPFTFAVLPFKALRDCRVSVSDLRGPGTIPAAAADVKVVQYARSRANYTATGSFQWVPDHLRTFTTVDAPADQNLRFWLTVTVPPDAAPGLYRGTVTFAPAGAPAAQVPLELRVLGFQLRQDPTRTYGIYYRDPMEAAAAATEPAAREFYERQAELQAQDMNAHGTVLNVPLSAYCSVPVKPEEPITWSLDWDLLTRRIDRCKRYGYAGPFVVSMNTGGLYARHMAGARPGSHLAGVKPCPPAFVTEMTAMVRYIEAGRQERGLPGFLYYPVDEPGGTPDQVAFMVQCLQAIRNAGAKTYVTADPTRDSFAPMRPFVDVWCTQPFEPSHEEVLKDSRERGVQYWCYPNHINGENDHTVVLGARMTYGFGFWRSGFVTLIPWIYSSTSGHPFNNLDAFSADFFNRPGPDGSVWPVPMWEAYREGWDDYRYVYTLQQAIAAARQAGRAAAAAEAQAVLDAIWQGIDVKPKYKLDQDCWGYRQFDAHRWQIAEQILKLTGAK